MLLPTCVAVVDRTPIVKLLQIYVAHDARHFMRNVPAVVRASAPMAWDVGNTMQVSAAPATPEKWRHLDISQTAMAFHLSPFTDGPSSQCVLTAHPQKVAGHGAVQLWCVFSVEGSCSNLSHRVESAQSTLARNASQYGAWP